ncbi:diguanylate cyclase [Clostridiaceae bacterium HSG29]|nr:diguanylate cyclase [Clostridiaceae bacterium HSG29]
MNKTNKKEIYIFILIIILIIFVFSILEYELIKGYREQNSSNKEELLNRYEEQYNTIKYSNRKLSEAYFNEVICNNEILEIIDEANNASEERKDELRKILSNNVEKIYNRTKKNKFRQFHFVLKDNESFLRMHAIDKYGDNLTDVRNTVRISNEKEIFVEGFEEGRIFNGYRFQYPLFNNEKHIGSMEISLSFGSIAELMKKLYNNQSIFMIKKSIVNEKVWEEQIKENYDECLISDLYYFDKEIYDYIEDENKLNKMISFLINDEKLDELLLAEESFLINYSSKNNDCSVIFLQIDNVIGNHVGYLVLQEKNNVFVYFKSNIIYKSILLISIALILIILNVFLYKSRIKMIKITYFDKLTGAFNRNKLEKYLSDEVEKSNRYDIPFSIIMFDFDHFKNVNDTYGHTKGDEVLKEVINIIHNKLRINDSIFRYGGDEFIIFLSNTELENALIVAEKLRLNISKMEKISDIVDNITLSMGVVEYDDDLSWLELINRADRKLYEAKKMGRNKVCF